MAVVRQIQLIGSHPIPPNEFGRCFISKDNPVTAKQCHRLLIGKIPHSTDPTIIEWLARKLILHHYDDKSINRLQKKYGELGFPKYASARMRLPKSDRTRKGNAAEIILIEYIEACQGKQLVKVFKFRFNPNVDQSMKGDDLLLVDLLPPIKGKQTCKIYLGESKFRKTPDKEVIQEIVNSLSKDKLPLSFTFLMHTLDSDPKTAGISDILDDLVLEEIRGKGGVIYAGFLWSNHDVAKAVDKHLSTKNPSLVFISASNSDPETLINEAFKKAEGLIKAPKKI